MRNDTLDLTLQRLAGSPEFDIINYKSALGVPALVKAHSMSDLLKVCSLPPSLPFLPPPSSAVACSVVRHSLLSRTGHLWHCTAQSVTLYGSTSSVVRHSP